MGPRRMRPGRSGFWLSGAGLGICWGASWASLAAAAAARASVRARVLIEIDIPDRPQALADLRQRRLGLPAGDETLGQDADDLRLRGRQVDGPSGIVGAEELARSRPAIHDHHELVRDAIGEVGRQAALALTRGRGR